MKVEEHLLYLARLKGLSRADAKQAIYHWMEKFDIMDWRPKKIQELSKGMQQKIQFIATVVHGPKLLILDEPFSGLDPINTNLIKNEIDELHRQGVSIIFSTHRMEQVEEICEHIVLINKGVNVLEGKVAGIKDRFKENLFQIDYEGELPAGLEDAMQIIQHTDHRVTIQLTEDTGSNRLLQYFLQSGVRIKAYNEILPSLNEIFIRQVESSNLFAAQA
jgi:ABC-2 type transport system ATP-binding protein